MNAEISRHGDIIMACKTEKDRKLIRVYFDSMTTGSPDSKAWHEWRQMGIGGSDAPHVAMAYGLMPSYWWQKPLDDLAKEKIGLLTTAFADNEHIRFGKEKEAEILAQVIEQTGIDDLAPAFGEHADYPFIRASFDGYSEKTKTIVEIKTTKRRMTKADLLRYMPQLLHQMAVAFNGHGQALLAVYYREEATLVIYDDWQKHMPETLSLEKLVNAEIDFWNTRVLPVAKKLDAAIDAWLDSLKKKKYADSVAQTCSSRLK
jgi:putative phage-type endonuclease